MLWLTTIGGFFTLDINPNYAETYNNRGNLYKDLQKYDLALSDYSKAIDINPNYAVAYLGRGLLYLLQQKYELALAKLILI